MAVTGAGLEGIIAAESQICFIDGDAGILSYRGFNIHTLAENATFEEVIFLLLERSSAQTGRARRAEEGLGRAPGNSRRSHRIFEAGGQVRANGCASDRRVHAVFTPTIQPPRTCPPEANQLKAVKLMAQTATIVTSFDRQRNGKDVVPGDPSLGFAANFLYTLTGKKPDEVMERAFDIALTLHADHELNASTFASRVVAATLSDIYSAATAGIAALKGPLHGGANEDVIKMLLEAGSADKAIDMVKNRLANKIKIPGFGHRVYKTTDPRATHLAELSEEVGKRTGHVDLYETSAKIEKYIKEAKGLNANVDFYSASTYYSLGIPIDIFTPIFAVSRMSGWTAHVLEQYHNNRLIRPRADYTGLPVGQAWVAMANR